MLSDDTAIRSVIIDEGALASARKGCVHVTMAAISPALVEELRALHGEAGVAYVAAPVLGVPAVAAEGQPNILAAGDPAAIAAIQPLLDALGRKTWRLGGDPVHANIAGNMMIHARDRGHGRGDGADRAIRPGRGRFPGGVTNTALS